MGLAQANSAMSPLTVATDAMEDHGRARRFVSNTLVQFISPAVRMLLGLVLAGALSRYLGVARFGEYALVFAYVATFTGVFNDWGLGTICLREISRRPNERARLVFSAAALQAFVGLASYCVMVASLMVVHYPGAVIQSIAIYGLTMLLMPVDILTLPFQADLRLTRLLTPSLLGTVLNFLLSMVVIVAHGPLLALVGAALASIAIQYAWLTRLSLRAFKVSMPPTIALWGPLVREAWPLGVATVVSTAILQAPLLALSLVSFEGVGLFNAANKIPQQLLILPFAIRATAFPLLSASWLEDRGRFTRQLERLIEGSLLVSIPIAILSIGLAEPLIRLLFGADFSGAAIPFALLVSGFALMFPGILIGEALTAAGFQRVNLVILSAGLSLLVVLLLVFVPAGGASGAALAVVSSYAVIVALSLVATGWRIRSVSLFFLPRAGLASASGAGILLLSRGLGPTLAAIIATAACFAALGLLNPKLASDLWRLGRVGLGVSRTIPTDAFLVKQSNRGSIKTRIARILASLLLSTPPLEKAFCHLCSRRILRAWFRLGGIAFAYLRILREPEMRVAQLERYKMYVNIAEPSGITAYFYRDSGTLWLASEIIGEGDTCIDAGANMGHYTLLMASKVGRKGRVVAFEPQPEYFRTLIDSVRLNNFDDFVSVDNRALWDRSGQNLKFYISQNPHNSGTSSLVNHGVYVSDERTIRVPAIRLSDYLQQVGIKTCKLLKVDVERAELQVLQGASELLIKKLIDFIILEMFSYSDSHEFLQSLNFSCFLIEPHNRRLLGAEKIEPGCFGDYVFVNPDRLANFREKYAGIIT